MKDEQKEQALTSGAPAPQSGNVGDHGHQGGLKLPGAGATTVRISALMNSLPRWFLKTSGTLRSFLLSILSLPRHKFYVYVSIKVQCLADASSLS